MPRLAITLAALALAPSAHAGIGGSTVSLHTCSPPSALYQNWSYDAGGSKTVAIAGDENRLWGSSWCLSAGNGITSLPPQVNSTVFTSPCGSALKVNLTPDAPRTALALGDASGLCVAVVSPAGATRGVVLQLAPCVAPLPDAQAFSLSSATGALVHVASGLCVDSGTRFKGCEEGTAGAGLPFCDVSSPIDDRVADLVARLTFDEKVAMLATASGGAPAVGVSPAQWWQESLHGVANNVGVAFDAPTPAATSFPQPILSSCSFNRSLWLATGRAVSDEVRAFSNVGHSGNTLWAPNINIARAPQWGRIQETPGEDSYLSGEYAHKYMAGMQEGGDPGHLKTSACCKHFAA